MMNQINHFINKHQGDAEVTRISKVIEKSIPLSTLNGMLSLHRQYIYNELLIIHVIFDSFKHPFSRSLHIYQKMYRLLTSVFSSRLSPLSSSKMLFSALVLGSTQEILDKEYTLLQGSVA